jgi:hypothetical protein
MDIIREVNVSTGEVIDRPLTAAEEKQWEADKQAQIEKQSELEALAETKVALLKRLGITAEEAVLLLA